MKNPLTAALALLALPLTRASAQDLGWQVSGYDWAGAVDLSVDVDGDGLADAIIGDPVAGSGGVVTVRSGATSAVVHTIAGPAGKHYGEQVVGIPDLNGDGHDEFGFNGSDGGLHVHDGMTGAELRKFTASGFETRIASIGDVNGDGYADIITSYPELSFGFVEVVSGRYMANLVSSPTSVWSELGTHANGHFGEAVTSIGDVDGDGIDEVVVGAPEEDGVSGVLAYHGQIHCLSGATGANIWTKRYFNTVSTRFGGALAAAGDVNGDGVEDVLAGAPWNDAGALDAGAVFVLNGVHGGYLEQLYHDVQGDLLGSGVASAGDVDQDGTPDHLFGAEGDGNSMGSVRLLSGASMNLIQEFAGIGFQGDAGTLSGGVDASGDGVSDFLIASPGGFGPGRVQLWHAECNGSHQSFCTSAANSSGNFATIHALGSESISANDLMLEARRCPPGKPGMFFYGTTAVQVPFGDGYRCAGGSARRLNPVVVVDPAGFAQLQLDFTAFPLGSGSGMVEAGDTRYFQYWFRDPAGPGGSGFNLTNGQRVTFCQ